MEVIDLKVINDKIEIKIEHSARLEIFSVFVSIEKFQGLISKIKKEGGDTDMAKANRFIIGG